MLTNAQTTNPIANTATTPTVAAVVKPVSLTTLAEGAATYDLPSLTAVIVLVDASNETVAPS